MKIQIESVEVNGRKGFSVDGEASSKELLDAIRALTYHFVSASTSVGNSKYAAGVLVAMAVDSVVSGGYTPAGGSTVVVDSRKMGGGNL